MTEQDPVIAGVELGGTKTALVLARDGQILEQHAIPTTTPAETLQLASEQLRRWMHQRPFAALGIAAFGPLDLDPASDGFARLFRTPKPGWTDVDLGEALTRELDCPWSIETDVNAAALAEARWGAGRDCDNLCYVTVGTGVGGGLVLNGKPVHGAMHPEIGHLRLRRGTGGDFPGTCPFHGDCTEGLVAGPALRRRFGVDPSQIPDDDPRWRLVASDLAEMVAAILLATAVRRVLLGGGVMLSRPFLLPRIRQALLQQLGGYLPTVREDSVEQIVMLAGLGASAGPLGAVAVGLLARSSRASPE